MHPLFFHPILKRIRWGGTRLGSLLGKPLADGNDYAESWEVADHGDDQSIVCSGPLAGQTLRQLVQRNGQALFGQDEVPDQFPLLIKFLDANDWLSLQVHPNDQQARLRHPRENGKTEAWVIIDAQPDSRICVGLKPGTSADQLRQSIGDGTVEQLLHLIRAQPGDCFYVPAGTVHAIGPGIVLAEIQQQSNLTYRLHDWGRVGSDGQPRPLHLEESLACTDFERGPVNAVVPIGLSHAGHPFEELVRGQYFVIRRHHSVNPFALPADGRLRILMTLEGAAILETDSTSDRLVRGTTAVIPASCPEVRVIPSSRVTMLEILPTPQGR